MASRASRRWAGGWTSSGGNLLWAAPAVTHAARPVPILRRKRTVTAARPRRHRAWRSSAARDHELDQGLPDVSSGGDRWADIGSRTRPVQRRFSRGEPQRDETAPRSRPRRDSCWSRRAAVGRALRGQQPQGHRWPSAERNSQGCGRCRPGQPGPSRERPLWKPGPRSAPVGESPGRRRNAIARGCPCRTRDARQSSAASRCRRGRCQPRRQAGGAAATTGSRWCRPQLATSHPRASGTVRPEEDRPSTSG